MTLGEFKAHISSMPSGTQFKYGISKPFSWRGSYNEVAFSISESLMSRESVLENIEAAYTEIFTGYKGGHYVYGDDTPVNFEEGHSRYSDGGYSAEMIAKIEGANPFKSQEERLVILAFS